MNIRWSSTVTRITLLGFLLLGGYVFLLACLWSVQIKKGEQHREAISRQSIRRIRIPSIRGRILTSDGHIIADNKPAFSVVLHLAEMRQPGRRSKTIKYILEQINVIARKVGRKAKYNEKDIVTHMNYKPGLPFTVFSHLNSVELARISEIEEPIPGMEVVVTPERFYPDKNTFAHILGYTGPEDPGRAEDKDEFSYYIPDQVGRRGVEKKYDKISGTPEPLRGLKGNPGGSVVRIDHRGYIFESISQEDVTNGNDIVLTINWRAQTILKKLFKGKTGAGVVLDASDGAVIAMVSSPDFDPNLFSKRISERMWNYLMKDKSRPMLNRAVNGAYTPGSIVKPLVAMALLENNADVSPIVCDGVTYIGNARVRCHSWRRGGHGRVDLTDSIAVSCNDFFIEKGMVLGMEKIGEMFRSAGLGKKTGFILPERKGLVPSRGDKHRIYGTRWNSYDTGLLSIGQGIILLTPLQAAVYTAAIADEGKIWRPYLLKTIKSPYGDVLYINKPERNGRLKVSQKNLNIVKKGMYKVVNAANGSGKKARNDKIVLYGKSGTGEVGHGANRYNNTWFISFGYHKDKKYAMVIFVERGASGGRTCAPMAGTFFDKWLKN